jgi:hypothetical protein
VIYFGWAQRETAQRALNEVPVLDEVVGLPSSERLGRGLAASQWLKAALMATRMAAPMTPPEPLSSLPIMTR